MDPPDACVAGENEEMSPWEPLHVEQGFSRDDSAVTLFFPNCYSQIWQYGSDDKGILGTLIYNLPPGRSGLTCLLMTPTQAKALAQKGWTKPMMDRMQTRAELYATIGYHDYEALDSSIVQSLIPNGNPD